MAAEVLPEPEREKLEEQIEQIEAAPEGVSKEKWEAVEDMEQRLENALAQSEASAYQLSSSMNQLAGMVAKQETKAPNVDNAEMQNDIAAMAAAIQDQLNKKNMPVSDALKKQLQDALDVTEGVAFDTHCNIENTGSDMLSVDTSEETHAFHRSTVGL